MVVPTILGRDLSSVAHDNAPSQYNTRYRVSGIRGQVPVPARNADFRDWLGLRPCVFRGLLGFVRGVGDRRQRILSEPASGIESAVPRAGQPKGHALFQLHTRKPLLIELGRVPMERS